MPKISNDDIRTSMQYAYLVGMKETQEVDLYDSGATRHMSRSFNKFINFVTIDPVPITAADKCTFQATGKRGYVCQLTES